MKALLLAGGFGTRLKLKTKPKPMVKVNGKPVLEHIINHLNKYGITEIIVKVHYKAEVIMKYFGTRVLYYFEPKLLNVEESEKNLQSWLGDEYIVMNGDTLTNIDIKKMAERKARETLFWNKEKNHYAGTKLINKNGLGFLVDFWDGDGAYYLDIGDAHRLVKARRYLRKHL